MISPEDKNQQIPSLKLSSPQNHQAAQELSPHFIEQDHQVAEVSLSSPNHQIKQVEQPKKNNVTQSNNSVQFSSPSKGAHAVECQKETTMLPVTAIFPRVESSHGNINNNYSSPSDPASEVRLRHAPDQPASQVHFRHALHQPVAEVQLRHTPQQPEAEETEEDKYVEATELRRTRPKNRGELRHAMSEILPNEAPSRRRSQTMANVKEHAYARLQEELEKAQEELKLKDEEVGKLLKVRDQMGEELEELTASLFEEANNMVQEANIKRIHSEKLLTEANQKIEVLQAEVVALKELVLTSTPNSPNKHLHPQIDTLKPEPVKKEKVSKPFWKTHRRSTSHHEFTKEARQEAEAVQEAKNDRCKDIDPVSYIEFVEWRKQPRLDKDTDFLSRVFQEDIRPCLNFTNKQLSEKLTNCVESNTLTIEPIPGDSSYPRRCCLTENNKLCNYKIKLGEDFTWYSISQLCRDRIATVCDFYTYIRYIHQGLVKSEDKEAFYEITRLRKRMALARLGYS